MSQEGLTALPRTGGNENTGLIKVFAILFMIVDHVGAAFFPSFIELRIVGRIAMPLFCWCICVGAEYTRNIWKYALRLLLVGALAQPCFMLGLKHQWYELNVYATLLLGLLGIAAIQKKQYWAVALVMLVPCAVKMDYGWQGVLFILLLYGCRKNTSSIVSLMVAYCLFWGFGSYSLTQIFGYALPKEVPYFSNAKSLLDDVKRIEFWAILALPWMVIPMKSRLRLPKWVWYAAYPGHLLVIGVIRNWSAITQWARQFL